MRYFVLLFLLFFSITSYGQNSDKHSATRNQIDKLIEKTNKLMYTNIDSAKIVAGEALTLAKKIKDNKLKARVYIEFSQIYLQDNDVPKAFEYIELAEILGNEVEDPKTLARSNFQKGTLFLVIGNNEKAIEYLDAAIKYSEEIQDVGTLPAAYNSLSLIYARNEEYDKAISTIQKAITINRKEKKMFNLASNYGNLSNYYNAKGDKESALAAIRQTFRIFIDFDHKGGMARSLVAIGDLYLQDKNYDSCLVYLNRAEQLIDTYNLIDPKLDFWMVEAEYEMKMHNYARALEYFTKVHELSTEFKYSQLMKTSIENMYKSAKAAGKPELALQYLESYKSISDSLEKVSGKQALVALELNEKFKNQQQLHEIEKKELRARERNTQLKAEKKNYLIASLILAGIILAGGAFVLIRRKQETIVLKEQEQLELTDELELKNKELVASAVEILRKSEEMKSTIESLEELNKHATTEDGKVLLSIIRKLKFELEHSSWEEFEVPFKQLHSRFYNNLVEMYPELTGAEIKVCSLLKLNLDTKQIAAILHKTPASIEVDRSRIRKKMGLTNTKTSLVRHITTNI